MEYKSNNSVEYYGTVKAKGPIANLQILYLLLLALDDVETQALLHIIEKAEVESGIPSENRVSNPNAINDLVTLFQLYG